MLALFPSETLKQANWKTIIIVFRLCKHNFFIFFPLNLKPGSKTYTKNYR